MCIAAPYSRKNKYKTVKRVLGHESKKFSNPVCVEMTHSACYRGKINILTCIWFNVSWKIDLTEPGLKKMLSTVALPVTKTPCLLPPVTVIPPCSRLPSVNVTR